MAMVKQQALGKRREAWLVGLGALHLPSLTLYSHCMSDCVRPSHHLCLWVPTSAAVKLFLPRAVPSSSLIAIVAPKSLLFPKPHLQKSWGFLSPPNSQSFSVCPPTTSSCARPEAVTPVLELRVALLFGGFFITTSVSPYVGSPNRVLHIPGARPSQSHGLQI